MSRRATVVVVAVLALVVGACGDDDDGDATDTASTTESVDDTAGDDEEDSDAATTTTGAPEDTDADDDSDDAEDSGGASGDSDWCELARDIESDFNLLDDVDPTDPDSVEQAYEGIIELMEDAAEAAPDEIDADIDTVVERTRDVFAELGEADFNILDVDPDIIEDADADAASDRIAEYNERECGIENDNADTEAVETDDTGAGDETSGEGTLRDQLRTQFTDMGMSTDQADCLIENMDLSEVAENGADDPSMVLDLFDTCDIELTDLQPDG